MTIPYITNDQVLTCNMCRWYTEHTWSYGCIFNQFYFVVGIYCDEYVGRSVCLSVWHNSKTTRQNGAKFLMHVGYGRGSGFLWWCCDMSSTSWFVEYVIFYTMGSIGQNQTRHYVSKKIARWQYKLDVRQLQCLVEFIRMQHPRGYRYNFNRVAVACLSAV